MAQDSPLPPMPFWQARSFWYVVAAAVVGLAKVAATLKLVPQTVADLDANQIADAVMGVLPLVLMALAYRRRLQPENKLTLK